MARYALLLRAVNVGGTGKLQMARLRDALTAEGFAGVETLLASGNAVFGAKDLPTAKLERRIEAALADTAELETEAMVRRADEWAAIISNNPMPEAASKAPAQLGVMVMKSGPDKQKLAAYLKSYAGPENVAAGDCCLYIWYTDGMGRSKLKIGRAIGTGAVRNWNAVVKIAERLGCAP